MKLLASRLAIPALISALTLAACTFEPASRNPEAEHATTLNVEVVATHPFNSSSFTQGLEVDGAELLVGTGQQGESRIYRSDLNGTEKQSVDLSPEFFGEGITRTNTAIWQLTWRNGIAIKRDPLTFEEHGTATFSGEGWGLCSFPGELVMSDGTSQLRFLDPETFVERRRIHITRDGEPVDKLNELECVDGNIYANRFLTTEIVRIDAASAKVTATIDASNLESNATPDPNNVLNGIAHIPGTDRFLLSGKRWPQLYEVRFVNN